MRKFSIGKWYATNQRSACNAVCQSYQLRYPLINQENHNELFRSALAGPVRYSGSATDLWWQCIWLDCRRKTPFSLLDALLEKGLNFIDTAGVYSRWAPGNQGGESETIIGNWLQHSGKRDRIILATKVGMDLGDGKTGLAAKYIRQAVEASLKRLRTDYIDLYQAHRDDQDTPLQESLGAFDALVKEGKVRVIGASNYSAERLQEALQISAEHGLARYETLQPEYNLYDRAEYESGLEQVATAHGLGVINYYSLASGFLSGKYRSKRMPRRAPVARMWSINT